MPKYGTVFQVHVLIFDWLYNVAGMDSMQMRPVTNNLKKKKQQQQQQQKTQRTFLFL